MMTDNRKDKTDLDLDQLFELARAERPALAPDLMTRILADAAQISAERRTSVPVAPSSGGFMAGLWAALGGWGGAGGLTAAAAAGLWLGIAPPQNFESLTTLIFGASETVSIFAADDILGTEG